MVLTIGDVAAASRDAALREREELLRARETELAERDEIIRAREATIEEMQCARETELAQRDEIIRAREATIEEMQSLIRELRASRSTRDVGQQQDTSIPVIDPENVPVRYVDTALVVEPRGNMANLVLGASHTESLVAGAFTSQVIIAARLRFTKDFARQLRDVIDRILLA